MKKILTFLVVNLLLFSILSYYHSGLLAFETGGDQGIHITSPSEGNIIDSDSFEVSGKFDTVQPADYTVCLSITVKSINKEYSYVLSKPSNEWGPITVSITDFGLALSSGTVFDCKAVAILENSTGIPVVGIKSRVYNFKWGIATAPLSPNLLSPQNNFTFSSNEEIYLKWSEVEGAEGYNIQLSNSSSFEDFILNKKLTSNSCDLSNLSLPFGKTYYWRISAFNKYGTSNWSSTWNFLIRDTIAPIIKLTSPIDNSSTTDSIVHITGTVVDNETGVKEVELNGKAISLSGGKLFDITVNLKKGKNVFVLVAFDKEGNKASKSFTVTYQESKPKEKVVINLQIENPLMVVNGVSQEIDPGRGTKPIIIPEWSRTVVPIRAIVEALGGTISWNGTERKVTINFNDTTIELWIDSPKAKVNGIWKWIDNNNHDVRPVIRNDRTMLPLRFVAESLGCEVDWYPETKAITITYQG